MSEMKAAWGGAVAAATALCVCADDLPPPRAWNDYRVIMWVGDSVWKQPDKFPLFLERLREMGVNTGMVHGDGDPKPWVENNFPYYVENIVNRGLCLKWNSKLQKPGGGDRWDEFVTEWSKTGRRKDAFIREYCFDDQQWLNWAKERMRVIARKHKSNQPLAYNIRDELSVTISANPFDYCFCPKTLIAFREWLRTQYNDLAALNEQWATKFSSWDEVMPFTTDEIKHRMASADALPRGTPDWQALQRLKFDPVEAAKKPTRWNFSPWCDFRTYMDISLARTLEELRRAAREIDPGTPVGIEGTQMPHAFGGYDLWRLSQVVDWIEPYDIGNAREILGSFMGNKPILTTVFETETHKARRRLWHLLLEGDKGCIIWWSEDCIDWNSPDYALTPKAKALAPVLKELTSPLAALFLRAKREYDPIALHYDQTSIQVSWLLESALDGSTWHRRFSSYEAEHSRLARERNAQLKMLQDFGYSPRFVSTDQIARDPQLCLIEPPTTFTISLPTSPRKGTFDGHGKWCGEESFRLPQERALIPQNSFERHEAMARDLLPRLPRLEITVTPRSGGKPYEARTAIRRYTLGAARLVAFERNITYHMSEDLRQAGGNEPLEKPIELQTRFSKAAHVYDLRAQKYLGHTNQLDFSLDPWQPTLLALLPEKVDEKNILEWLADQN